MNRWLLAVSLSLCSMLPLLPLDAEAKRLGGGGSVGLKRDLPARTAPDAPPPKPAQDATPSTAAAPTAAPAAAAPAAAPKRSWMGPIAGLAAGLGLAALASHLGLGEELANFVMLALLAIAAIVLVRWLLRRIASPAQGTGNMRLAGAGAPAGPSMPAWREAMPAAQSALPRGTVAAAATAVPSDFDAQGFARVAKMIFIRLQAAHDAGDLDDLRAFTTPELFASIRLDLQERGGASQQTDVVQIDAEVLDVAEQDGRQIVSVRFHGLIREARDGGATPFDEVWHLVRPSDASREWAIAGIQQTAAAH